ncbi:MAG: STAS domain-containing protein [Chthoniobacter sp.]|nr:STAS domain-containing protein [Chthoniobacter sp.]
MATTPQNPDAIFRLEGEVDLHRAPEIRAALAPVIARKLPRLLMDLSAVSYIDSSGLALLIETLQSVQTNGGTLRLFGLSDSVRAIFHVACLDQVFAIFPDLAAAEA